MIDSAQKGFLPYEGSFEHTFLLRSCLEDARRRKRKIGGGLVGPGERFWFGSDRPFAGVHEGAGTDCMSSGRSEGHLHRFDHEGED